VAYFEDVYHFVLDYKEAYQMSVSRESTEKTDLLLSESLVCLKQECLFYYGSKESIRAVGIYIS